jgi:hypothetical protein
MLKDRFLGSVLLAPAVDTLIDASLEFCQIGCCCEPKNTHTCSIVHPFYCGLVSCLLGLASFCPSMILPFDDPSTGNSGYIDNDERLAYRNSSQNVIGYMKSSGLKTLFSIMKRIQQNHWTGDVKFSCPIFLLYAEHDNLVPASSIRSFARSRGLVTIETATPVDLNISISEDLPESLALALGFANHQILAKHNLASNPDAADAIATTIIPIIARWLDARVKTAKQTKE